MIHSMTGFGRAERTADGWRCRVELRSVNGRFLEVRIRLPSGLTFREEQAKAMIKASCTRGRFECSVALDPEGDDAAPLTLNLPLARAYGKMLEQFRQATGEQVVVSLRDLVELKDLVQTENWQADQEGADELVRTTFAAALAGLVEMREKEGGLIAQELDDRVQSLAGLLAEIAPLAAEVPERQGRRLREGLTQQMGERPLQDERILQELAILAERSDVSEEIARFGAHLQSLTDMMGDGGPLGRKFEFVLQELNREANTLSAKCGHPRVGGLVVDVKAELERLREQIQNIE